MYNVCTIAHAKDLNEQVHLALQESYSLPILTYAAVLSKKAVTAFFDFLS